LQSGNAAADDANRSEARARFDRGLTLFNQGDNQGALAEFQAAYQLTGNPTVLYNIARVQAAADEPVAALETLDKLVAEPGDLSPARRDQLRALRQEQQQRVGSVTVRAVGIAEARVEVDGADAGALEPTRPLRLAAGRHVVGVLAPGHHPLRKTVLVAGQQEKVLEFAPELREGALGRVRFALEPLDVVVLLDGQELGKAPHLVEIAVAPGRHRLALERAGYRRVERDIVVPEGGTLEVSEKLGFDPASRAGHDGRISVTASEEDAVMFVNGVVTSAAQGVALPEGQHRLRVERAGFVPSERTIVVRRGSTSIVDVTLAPTAEYRADYTSSTRSRRGWALGIGIAGAALAGTATGYLLWNGKQISTAENDFEHAERSYAATCDVEQPVDCDSLFQVAQIRLEDLGDKRDRQIFGWVGLGVGAAALTTGAVLWLTGRDPSRYEPKPESDVFGSLSLTPWSNGRDAAGLVVAMGSN
jgi:hypothetical protein